MSDKTTNVSNFNNAILSPENIQANIVKIILNLKIFSLVFSSLEFIIIIKIEINITIFLYK